MKTYVSYLLIIATLVFICMQPASLEAETINDFLNSLKKEAGSQTREKKRLEIYTEAKGLWEIPVHPESQLNCSVDEFVALFFTVEDRDRMALSRKYSKEELLPSAKYDRSLMERVELERIKIELLRKKFKKGKLDVLAQLEQWLREAEQSEQSMEQMRQMTGFEPWGPLFNDDPTSRLRNNVETVSRSVDELSPSERSRLQALKEGCKCFQKALEMESQLFARMNIASDNTKVAYFRSIGEHMSDVLKRLEKKAIRGAITDEDLREYGMLYHTVARSCVAFNSLNIGAETVLCPVEWFESMKKRYTQIMEQNQKVVMQKEAQILEMQQQWMNKSNDAFQHMLDVQRNANDAVCGRCNRTYYRSLSGCPQCDLPDYGVKSFLYQEDKDDPGKTRVFY